MSWTMREEFQVLEQLGRTLPFPDHYFVADLETTGFTNEYDFIIELGWGVVRDRQLRHNHGLLLDWTKCPQVNADLVRGRLEKQRAEYQKMGRPHYYPWERLCAEGVEPIGAIHGYVNLLWQYIQRGEPIVGHGLWSFDRRIINSHTIRFLNGYTLPWKENSIFDTGLTEKAMQMNSVPWQGETLDHWYNRVNAARIKGLQWSMETHCVPKYQLATRYGLDMRLMHTGGFDCSLIYYFMETLRQFTEVLDGKAEVHTIGWYYAGQGTQAAPHR